MKEWLDCRILWGVLKSGKKSISSNQFGLEPK